MAISGIGGVGGINLNQLAQQYRQQVQGADATSGAGAATQVTGGGAANQAAATRGADFAKSIESSLNNVAQLDQTAQNKAISAATGDLTDVHDYVIAATQAQVATELTTTVRNKALDSFNEIMRMPL
ncbi:flagellar hook-basal body complex protein FliE [Spongisporangium articulatum]|uniref:Flagellar hook-basal body complex protein FliE n=1 Tax=Spongisporangium articulatum TaxID=3362603 RepID=A0ABW8AHN5_9ACTN